MVSTWLLLDNAGQLLPVDSVDWLISLGGTSWGATHQIALSAVGWDQALGTMR